MPESKSRKKPAYIPPPKPAVIPGATTSRFARFQRFYAPVMVVLMVIGLIWIVTAYVTQLAYPVPGIGPWNIAAGFGVALVGFVLLTRWH